MISIFQLLSRIKWDIHLKESEYKLYYLDRTEDELEVVKVSDIRELTREFMTINDTEIPLHRVRKVTRRDKIIWER